MESQNDRLLNGIIVYGFACAFGLVIASSQALQPTTAGFSIELSWKTLLALAIGAVLMVPFFHVIVYSPRKSFRRGALALVVLVGLGAFFYPMRVVPREKLLPIFTGLAVAIFALSVLAGLLVILSRFFESEGKQGKH
jgi:Na+-transporting NADH:ubiquinone oxidoreductase subunit NqrB